VPVILSPPSVRPPVATARPVQEWRAAKEPCDQGCVDDSLIAALELLDDAGRVRACRQVDAALAAGVSGTDVLHVIVEAVAHAS
jgi:hypothetical protein